MHIFEYKLPDEFIRGLNRESYKRVCRWLRVARNHVEQQIDIKKLEQAVVDIMVHGTGVYEPNR